MIIADTLNDCRRKLTLDGTISTLAGLGSGYDGPAAQASFNNPVGIAIDAEGNIIIADADNKALRKLTPDGTVSTLAGSADFQWSRSNDCVPRTFLPTRDVTPNNAVCRRLYWRKRVSLSIRKERRMLFSSFVASLAVFAVSIIRV